MGPAPRHKVVVAAIVERDGRILICRRPAGAWGAGLWEFPGGKLEVGEEPRSALARECREELGVNIQAGEVFDIVSHTYPDLGPVLLVFFRARLVAGEPRAIEVGELRWETPERLAGYDWLPADAPIIQRLAGAG